MKKIWIIAGVILVVAAIAAGSFYGGVIYQENKASQVQEQFFNARGGQPPTGGFGMQMDGEFQGSGNGPAVFSGRGMVGQIKAVNGDALLVTTDTGVITVHLMDTTIIQKLQDVSADELSEGTSVSIMGQPQDDGSISAEQIQIVDAEALQNMPPQSTTAAP